MIVMDANVFNKEVVNRILRLADKAQMINPENINVLPFSPFADTDDESAIGPGSALAYPEYDDNAIVNSIRMGKIKSMIRHLKVNKQKYLLEESLTIDASVIDADFAYDLVDASGNGIYQSSNHLTISIPVPDGFDGRKCFPFYGFFPFGSATLESWADRFSFWMNGQKTGTVGAEIFQNQTNIKFEFRLIKDSGQIVNPDIYIKLIYWENVL